MTTKRVTISAKPPGHPRADAWVHSRTDSAESTLPAKADLYTARLTIDVTPALRGRLKVAAFQQGAVGCVRMLDTDRRMDRL